MKILNDLLSAIEGGAVVRDIRQGPFQTAVLTHNCGLASTLLNHAYHRDRTPVKEAGTLIGREALEIAKMAYSPSLLEASIGMATINALLKVDEGRCLNLNAASLLAEKGKNKKVALIGHFPFVPELRQAAEELWVIEQRPQEEDFAEGEAESLVPRADVVGITGTAFTNHTIEHLLSLCPPQAYVIILGPTAPLSCVLFDHGINAISGTKVVDPEVVLRCISQGATFHQIRGVQLLTMERNKY